MNVSTLFLVFLTQSADSQAIANLFDVLDKDGDGTVSASEISDSQRPYFQRALRVSDHNEDGALTRDELTVAVTDPQPVTVSAQGRPANFDLTQFDRNKDGSISKDEVPQPLQQRLQRAFDQYGKDSIPISELQKMARGQAPSPPARNRAEMKKSTDETSTDADQSRLLEAVKRLDQDGDGKLSRSELRRSPQLARALDRNRDGVVSASELAAAKRDTPEMRPRRGTDSDSRPAKSPATDRPNPGNAKTFFDRLDTNKDGKLTRDEVPQRMRQNMQQIDRDDDKTISLQEFTQAVRRQQQRSQ